METKQKKGLNSQKIEMFGFHFSVFDFEMFPIFECLNLKEINLFLLFAWHCSKLWEHRLLLILGS